MATAEAAPVIRHRFDEEFEFDNMLLNAKFNDKQELGFIRDQLEMNSNDVISASHPKTGSTWVNEIIYRIIHQNSSHNADEIPFEQKLLFLECHSRPCGTTMEQICSQQSPRLFKTHLPVQYFRRNLEKGGAGPRVVLAVRDPKDTLVSYYHFYRMDPHLGSFPGTFADFFELFQQKHLLYEDFFDYYAGWLELGAHPNVLLVKYEELQKNPRDVIRQMAVHVGRPLSAQALDKVVEKTAFRHMQSHEFASSNPWNFDSSVSRFFRKGQVGDWKNYFTQEQSDHIDRLCAERLTPRGLQFEFELPQKT